jgi:hypothetical protein
MDMESKPEQDKTTLALTKWLPMSVIGAGITFVTGFVLHLQPPQVITSVGLTAALIFSGLAMNSRGRGRNQ